MSLKLFSKGNRSEAHQGEADTVEEGRRQARHLRPLPRQGRATAQTAEREQGDFHLDPKRESPSS